MPGLRAMLLGAVAFAPQDDALAPREEAPTEVSAPDDEGARLERAGQLWERADGRFELSDYEQAVELYEEVYLLLFQSGGVNLGGDFFDLQLSLAQACVLAHERSGELRYLERARVLWTRLIAEQAREVDAGWQLLAPEQYTQTSWRADREAVERPDGDVFETEQLGEYELELVYVEELLAAHQAREADEQARQLDIAEAARRQIAEDDRARAAAAQREAARAAQRERDAARSLKGFEAGGALVGVALAAGGVTLGALARGAALEREGERVRNDPELSPEAREARYDELIAAGSGANAVAITAGTLAGISCAVGIGLLVYGGVVRARGERDLSLEGGRAAWRPLGLEVRF